MDGGESVRGGARRSDGGKGVVSPPPLPLVIRIAPGGEVVIRIAPGGGVVIRTAPWGRAGYKDRPYGPGHFGLY